MKSLERRFKNIQERNVFWSTYLCFAEAVKAQNFGKQAISRWFNKLVGKDEFASGEKKEVLSFLETLSKPVRATENEGKTALQSEETKE
jgi:hypothetical protein